MEKLITIYTPTYNRAYLLPRVYNCLCAQTCKDFVWMIIDDGSTDNTRALVNEWIKKRVISIEYYYKKNGGVHTARDMAYHLCQTTLIACCDSDDMIAVDAVENWLDMWNKHGGSQYSGIFSVAIDEKGTRVTDDFPHIESVSYQDYTYKYKCGKEKDAVMNMEAVSTLEDYPVFEDEKLVGEGFKWIQFPQNKPFLLMDKVTRIYEQQPDGYMSNVASSRFKNPKGYRELYRQTIKKSCYCLPKFRGYIGYVAFSIILKDRNYIKNAPNPIIATILTPIGFIAYIRFSDQKRKADIKSHKGRLNE